MLERDKKRLHGRQVVPPFLLAVIQLDQVHNTLPAGGHGALGSQSLLLACKERNGTSIVRGRVRAKRKVESANTISNFWRGGWRVWARRECHSQCLLLLRSDLRLSLGVELLALLGGLVPKLLGASVGGRLNGATEAAFAPSRRTKP